MEGLDSELFGLVSACIICSYLQIMEIRGALNAIIKLKGYKLVGGDSRGLLIDQELAMVYTLVVMEMVSPLCFYFQ